MTTTRARLAIVEDNLDLQEELAFFLQARGYPVWSALNAEVFWKRLHANPVDVVLLDLGLPGEDGLSMLKYLREIGGYGLIVMTARGERESRQQGLDLGADLYRVKPVNFAQLACDIDALWARLAPEPAPPSPRPTQGGWVLDTTGSHLRTPDGAALKLTPQEHRLLASLLKHPGDVISKRSLHDILFETAPETDLHRIDAILSRLRQKAAQHGLRLPIRTVFGQGIAFLDAMRD